MGHRMRGLQGCAIVLGLVAWLACAAPALADTEPNDVISQAEGPVGGGAPITGTLGTPDDVDYYLFYAASQQQLHLTVDDLTAPDSDCLTWSILDTDGGELPDDYSTAPGTNRYFVVLSHRYESCSARTYRFEIDPGGGVVSGPHLDRSLTQTSEPNETPGQASGPLSANINYVGAHETTNDEDWFWFWVPAGSHQLDVSTTGPSQSGCSAGLTLSNAPSEDGDSASASGDGGSFGHIRETLTGPALAYLKAGPSYDCLGSRWQFRIETPGAVTLGNPFPPPPPPPPPPKVEAARYASVITLRRRGARYSGRVVSSRPGCQARRLVTLRRVGSHKRSFGSMRSRSRGTFTIRRSRRLHGRVYAVVTQRASSTVVCRSARSRRIRG